MPGYPVSSSVWSQEILRPPFNYTNMPTSFEGGSDADAMMTEQEGQVPQLMETVTEAKYLLVIEKQGIFLRLCEDAFHR